MITTRRKLGKFISDPIDDLVEDKHLENIVFIEADNKAAMQTRAAALMYAHRHGMKLYSKVVGNEVRIMKERDSYGKGKSYDLR